MRSSSGRSVAACGVGPGAAGADRAALATAAATPSGVGGDAVSAGSAGAAGAAAAAAAAAALCAVDAGCRAALEASGELAGQLVERVAFDRAQPRRSRLRRRSRAAEWNDVARRWDDRERRACLGVGWRLGRRNDGGRRRRLHGMRGAALHGERRDAIHVATDAKTAIAEEVAIAIVDRQAGQLNL